MSVFVTSVSDQNQIRIPSFLFTFLRFVIQKEIQQGHLFFFQIETIKKKSKQRNWLFAFGFRSPMKQTNEGTFGN